MWWIKKLTFGLLYTETSDKHQSLPIILNVSNADLVSSNELSVLKKSLF